MNKFKVGEKVRATKDCLPIKKGVIYTVKETSMGILFIGVDFRNSCVCSHTWEKIEKTWDNLAEGDEINDYGSIRTVLGICGRVILLSTCDNKDSAAGCFYTKEELINRNYTIVQPKTEEKVEKTELTLQQIADKFNLKVEDIRIKE